MVEVHPCLASESLTMLVSRQVAALPSLKGCEAKLRMGSAATGSKVDGDKPAVTDNGNYIVDLFFKTPIKDPPKVP